MSARQDSLNCVLVTIAAYQIAPKSRSALAVLWVRTLDRDPWAWLASAPHGSESEAVVTSLGP